MDSFIFFDRPWLFQLLVFLVIAGLGLGLSQALLSILGRRHARGVAVLPVAPAFVSIGTVFALFLGFLAADIWAEKRRAEQSASREHAALQRFAAIAGPGGIDDAAALAAHGRYLAAVVDGEWGDRRNRSADPEATAALRQMWAAATALEARSAGAAGHLLRIMDDLVTSREERLNIGRSHGSMNAWATVLVLAVFSYVTLAAVHLDRPPAAWLMLLIFAVATTTVFMFLALHDSPYTGGVRLDSDLLLPGR